MHGSLTRVGLPVVGILISVCITSGCGTHAESDRIARNRSSIIGGRPSGDDENAAIIVGVEENGVNQRCSGYLVAPRLAVTARHCILFKIPGSACSPDGTPLDSATAGDLTPAPTDKILVQVGSDRSALRNVKVEKVLATTALSTCKADIAFLVLAEAALDVHTPIRLVPVRTGDTFSVTGWGRTSDGSSALPARRSTLDGLRVKDIGPGFIPIGAFASLGGSLCFGDSGAAALIDGALAGIYSRISGNCEAQASTNVFSGIASERDLVDRAFTAIGEKPVYIENTSPAPDVDASSADARAPVPNAEPSSDGGCTMGSASNARASTIGFMMLGLAVIFTRRRQRPCLRINL